MVPTATTCATCTTSDTWRAGGCRKELGHSLTAAVANGGVRSVLALLGCSAGQWKVSVQSPQSSLVSHAVMRSSVDEVRPLPSVGSCASPRTVPGAGAPRRALLHPMDPHPATRCTPSAPEKNNLEEKTSRLMVMPCDGSGSVAYPLSFR